MKDTVVRTADRFLRAALAGIALVLMGTQLLVFDVAVDREAGVLAAGVTLVVLLAIAVLQVVLRRRQGRA